MSDSKTAALIVASGIGIRFAGLKQYHQLRNGQSILQCTAQKFIQHPSIDIVCIVINKNHQKEFQSENLQIPYTYGGDTRQSSVKLGLEFLQQYSPKNVLIHDVVRPFVSNHLISSVISELDNYLAVDIALPLLDTIKTYTGQVLQRDELYSTQTPQGFDFETILKLHLTAIDKIYTDDISLYLENFGKYKMQTVIGCPNNIKITYKTDLKQLNI